MHRLRMHLAHIPAANKVQAGSSLFSRQAGTTAGAASTRSPQRSCGATSAEGTLAALDGATVCARPRGETSAERPLAGSGGACARPSGATSAEGALVASGGACVRLGGVFSAEGALVASVGATACTRPRGATSGGNRNRNPNALCTQPQDAGGLPSLPHYQASLRSEIHDVPG